MAHALLLEFFMAARNRQRLLQRVRIRVELQAALNVLQRLVDLAESQVRRCAVLPRTPVVPDERDRLIAMLERALIPPLPGDR